MSTYSMGHAEDPKADDPRFDEQQAALDAAISQSEERYEEIWAVWEDEYGEILYLVHNGIPYKPMD